jgi:hypothetical protein
MEFQNSIPLRSWAAAEEVTSPSAIEASNTPRILAYALVALRQRERSQSRQPNWRAGALVLRFPLKSGGGYDASFRILRTHPRADGRRRMA